MRSVCLADRDATGGGLFDHPERNRGQPAQASPVGRDAVVLAERVERRLEHLRERRLARNDEPVVHPEALFATRHEACPAQVREVTRGGRLWDAERAVNVADADLAAGEQSEDAQPGVVGKCPEEAFEVLDGWGLHIRLDEYITTGIHIFARANVVGAGCEEES